MRPRILTVFREGGDYRWEHVERLQQQCATHAPEAEFLCLRDELLFEGWPGWWAKMSLFRYAGPILYFDLDTSIVGDLAPLLTAAQRNRFVALRNPLRTPSRLGSGIMAWSGDMSHVYHRFRRDPDAHMRRCVTPRLWGDQGFISESEMPDAHWQDLLPGQVLSWKADCKAGVPKHARVVYFHGTPRPWDIGM